MCFMDDMIMIRMYFSFFRSAQSSEAFLRRLDAETSMARLLGHLKPQEEHVVRFVVVVGIVVAVAGAVAVAVTLHCLASPLYCVVMHTDTRRAACDRSFIATGCLARGESRLLQWRR